MDLAEVARRLELESLYTDYAACLTATRWNAAGILHPETCRYRVTSAEN
jgi:hypothetical protein